MTWKHPREVKRLAKLQKRRPIFPAKSKFKHWEACAQSFFDQLNPMACTCHEYERYLRQFFARDNDKTPDKYARADVERWLNEPTAKGQMPSPSYFNCKLNALSSFYTYAAGYEYQFREQWKPLLTRQPPTNKVSHRKDTFRSRAMTDDEMRRFFSAIESSNARPLTKKRDRALFLLYFWTARRRREISDLLWGDIERKLFYSCGENVEVWIYKWRGKGHMSKDDSAEIPAEAVEALIEYLETNGRWGKMKPEDPLFPGIYGEVLDADTVGYSCHRYMRLAGLSESGVHRFRHTRAVATYEETGNDIVAVSKLLRHNSIDMTRRYVQAAAAQRDATAPKLRKRFGGL